MQLEVEKRGQRPPDPQPSGPSQPLSTSDQTHSNVGSSIKDEASLPDCSSPQQPISTGSQTLVAKKAVVIKQEVPIAQAEQQSIVSQFYVSSQGQPPALVAQPQALLTTQTTQLLLPVSIQGSNVTSVQLPVGSLQLQTPVPGGAQAQPQVAAATQVPAAALAPALPQKQEAFPQHVLGQPQPVRKPSSPSPAQQFVIQHSLFGTPVTKTKDPPRYEEAIKQTRSAQPAVPE
ncbi:hypothetical protein A6R68_02418, partial [Neotoma lepida]